MKAWTLFKNWLIVKLGGYTEEHLERIAYPRIESFYPMNAGTKDEIEKSFEYWKFNCLPIGLGIDAKLTINTKTGEIEF